MVEKTPASPFPGELGSDLQALCPALRRDYPGMGLGLNLVAAIAISHRPATSGLSKATPSAPCFAFALPLIRRA